MSAWARVKAWVRHIWAVVTWPRATPDMYDAPADDWGSE